MKKYIDLRERNDYDSGHVPGAYHLDLNRLSIDITTIADLEDELLLYCYSGNRSGLGASLLQEMGYNAKSIGGISRYKGELEC
ncbi:MAG: rhodanese-like domain-containing protein [Tissierellia bacterium]|nr:rhodanese-like domain-containing protein [Tissierellia bacterium]